MGQAFKRLLTWSTSGKLGLKIIGLYEKKAPVRNGVEGLEKQREQRENTLYLEKTWVYI